MKKKKNKKTTSQLGKMRRRKGSNFENKIATIVRQFLSASREEVFRTPLSGGHQGFTGDIQVHHKYAKKFPFCIECKCEESWNLDGLLSGTNNRHLRWAEQVLDVVKDGDIPVVIFSKNRTPIYAYLPVPYFEPMIDLDCNAMVIDRGVVISLEDFFVYLDEIMHMFNVNFSEGDFEQELKRYKGLIRDRQKKKPRG